MIYFIHRLDRNPGDFWSSPRHYFNFKSQRTVDIFDKSNLQAIPNGSKCIVGGGGLFKEIFTPYINILIKKKCQIVFWGLGERYEQNLDDGWIEEDNKTRVHIKSFNPNLHLVSTRSLEPGIEWIPCASCNHIIFDRIKHQRQNSPKIKILRHKRVPIPNKYGFEEATNDPLVLEDFIQFIIESSVLITNSYHASYWAYLLGVKTICVPFSSGHYRFPGEIIYAKPSEAGDVAAKLIKDVELNNNIIRQISQDRLLEHRSKSLSFYHRVIHFLS